MRRILTGVGRISGILMLMGVTACTPSAPAASIGAQSVRIIQPQDGSTVPAGSVTVTVQVSGFTLVDKLGQANVAGEGHIHYFLDVTPPITPGQPAVTAAGTYAPTASTSYTWPNVAEGTHIFWVELVNNDHTPLNPPVDAMATVVVAAVTPAAGSAATGTPTATAPAPSGGGAGAPAGAGSGTPLGPGGGTPAGGASGKPQGAGSGTPVGTPLGAGAGTPVGGAYGKPG